MKDSGGIGDLDLQNQEAGAAAAAGSGVVLSIDSFPIVCFGESLAFPAFGFGFAASATILLTRSCQTNQAFTRE